MSTKKITLATLSTATEQEVFDQVAAHLLTQKKKALGAINPYGDEGCVYRAHQGDGTFLKCAAGCLIGDGEYFLGMENETWFRLVKKGVVTSVNSDLIADLQFVHDENEPEEWSSRLRRVAKQCGLDTSVIDNIGGDV